MVSSVGGLGYNPRCVRATTSSREPLGSTSRWIHRANLVRMWVLAGDDERRLSSKSKKKNRPSLRTDCFLDDLNFFVGQTVQLVDDFIDEFVSLLDLRFQFLDSLFGLHVTLESCLYIDSW